MLAINMSLCRSEDFASRSLLEISPNLRRNPSADRHRDTIPNHSVRIVVATDKIECVRYSLQSRIFANSVWPHAVRKSWVSDKSSAQVFRVVSNASWCDVAAFWITDDRPISIFTSETSSYVIRNTWRCVRFEFEDGRWPGSRSEHTSSDSECRRIRRSDD